MKIEGQKYLFGNCFERMTIEEKKDGIVCRVKPSISGKLLTGKNISGGFKEDFNNSKEDYERVLKLIKYFLRYNTITILCENKCDYRVNNRKSIEIIGNRRLVLSVNNNTYTQQILTVIKNKCLYDLENILFDTLDREKVVSISFYKADHCRIEVFDNYHCDRNFDIVRVPEEKCISIYYAEFMKENIHQIIIKLINNLLERSKNHCSCYTSGYMHVKIENLQLSFCLCGKEFEDEIKNIISKHNWDLPEFNQKQMKLKYGKRR